MAEGTLNFDAVFFDKNKWYEIDTVPDLHQAELIFPHSPQVTDAERPFGPLATDLHHIGATKKTVPV